MGNGKSEMVEIQDLSFGYNKHTLLFDHLNFTLNKGGICGLLGKNGAGKTSLLKIIAGLVFPLKGNCRILSHTPSKRLPEFLNELFFLSEDLYVPGLTGDQYVDFFAPFYPHFDHALFSNCQTEFELPKNKLLTRFSHGQKKKFLIAFGIATNCRLFILDEPTNGLDIPSKTQFRKLIASTISDEKLIIISTHQVHDVEKLVDTIAILENGNIIYHEHLLDQDFCPDLEELFNTVVHSKQPLTSASQDDKHALA